MAELTAVLLYAYSATFVDGLLQTEDYAGVLLASDPPSLERRLKRQQLLTREKPPRLVAVLEENVLMREVGSRKMMHAQCEHLLKASEWENVTLQIAPTAYYRGISGSFNIATQAEGDQVLYQETSTGGTTSNQVRDILHCVSAFAEMQARCLSVNDSQEFLRRAVDRWST